MIITDAFIYIHQPKTAGTFVTHVLSKLYEEDKKHSKKLSDRKTFIYDQKLKHAKCLDIPKKYSNRRIIATVRNPYDRYVSQYKFRWWALYPETYCSDIKHILRVFPDFPNLSFEEYLRFANTFIFRHPNTHKNAKDRIGWHTWQFLNFYSKKPLEVFNKLSHDYITSESYERDMFSVTYLHTDNINTELHRFLYSIGFKKTEIDFILHEARIYPPEGGRTSQDTWQKYYTPHLKQYVRKLERYLFTIFPEFDI